MLSSPCVNFNTTFNCSSTSKSRKSRYINADESITKALTASTLKVYLALRFEIDFKKDVAFIKKSAQEIADAAGIGRSRTFTAFNELESVGLLQRQQTQDRRTTYFVAKTLGHFTTLTPKQTQVVKNSTVHNLDCGVQEMDTYQDSYSGYINKGGMFEDYENYINSKESIHPVSHNRSDYYYKHAINNQINQKKFINKQKQTTDQEAEEGKQRCFKDEKCRAMFEEKLSAYEITYEEILQACFEYYWFVKKLPIYPYIFSKWIKSQCPKKQGYRKKQIASPINKSPFTAEEDELIRARRQELRMPGLECMTVKDRYLADELIARISSAPIGALGVERVSALTNMQHLMQGINLCNQHA